VKVSRLTPDATLLIEDSMVHLFHGGRLMKRNTKRLVKAVAGLAAAAVVEKAIDKASAAATNRRMRRKAAEVGKAVREGAAETAKTAGKKARGLKAAAKKQLPVVRKKAAKQLERLAKMTAP
jgi:hypothetical protein